MTTKFDMDEAVKALLAGQPITGEGGVLTPLIKQLTEAALNAELDLHLKEQSPLVKNRKNGKSSKQLKTGSGTVELSTPRDRNGTFEPQLVKKHQTTLSDEIEGKILSLYSFGMGYQDIGKQIQEMYGVNFSTATISAVTDKIIPMLNEWQQRPLESHYPIVWMDAIHYKVKEDGTYKNKAIYTILGIKMDGRKSVLGLYLSESEGASFWLSVLADLQQRGVKDILIACVDGLTGFPEAINTIYPQTEVQLCIVHQIRNSLKYVASRQGDAFMKDLRLVYQASTEQSASLALDELEKKWGEKYPIVIRSWRQKWHHLSAYFKYPEPIRKVIYTTNAIESVHRQFRKLTKTKGAFPNDKSLLKLLYMGVMNAEKKWVTPPPNWNITLSQLAIYFEGRLDEVIML